MEAFIVFSASSLLSWLTAATISDSSISRYVSLALIGLHPRLAARLGRKPFLVVTGRDAFRGVSEAVVGDLRWVPTTLTGMHLRGVT
jgi:hypothetical protein